VTGKKMMSSAFALLASSVALGAEAEKIGSWSYQNIVNKHNISKEFLAISFDNNENGIIFKCEEIKPNSVYAVFVSESNLSGDYDRRDILFKIDNHQSLEQSWAYVKNSATSTNKSETLSLAKKMKQATTLFVEAYTYDHNKVEAEFDISGADQMLNRLYADCKDGHTP
jgi:hypothetical protein